MRFNLFQVSLNCKFALHFNEDNRTLHIYILLFRIKYKKKKERKKQTDKQKTDRRLPTLSGNIINSTAQQPCFYNVI